MPRGRTRPDPNRMIGADTSISMRSISSADIRQVADSRLAIQGARSRSVKTISPSSRPPTGRWWGRRQDRTITGTKRGELGLAENRRSRACKPVCQRDAVEQGGTWKTRRAARDEEPSCPRGQRIRERRPGMPETGVVVLITQRSQVQILPPLPKVQVRGLFRSWERPSVCVLCTLYVSCARNCARSL